MTSSPEPKFKVGDLVLWNSLDGTIWPMLVIDVDQGSKWNGGLLYEVFPCDPVSGETWMWPDELLEMKW